MTSMASRGDFERLPLIDVSGLRSPALSERQQTALELDRAAQQVGFFYAVDHGLAQALLDDLERAAAEFFALSRCRQTALLHR